MSWYRSGISWNAVIKCNKLPSILWGKSTVPYKVHSKKVAAEYCALQPFCFQCKSEFETQSTQFCTCWIHRPVQTCNWLNNVRGNQANCGRRYFRLSPGPKRCYLNWRQKHPFSPNPVVYTNIGIPSSKDFSSVTFHYYYYFFCYCAKRKA